MRKRVKKKPDPPVIFEDEYGPYCIIPLTQDYYVKVDPEDFEYLKQWRWSISSPTSTGTRYAVRGMKRRHESVPTTIAMHRQLLNVVTEGPEISVDHENGDGLDNRKANLRLANATQQSINRPTRQDNTSGYKGVYKAGNRWRAQISFEGRKISLGMFDNIEDAAAAYDRAAEELHGEWRRTE